MGQFLTYLLIFLFGLLLPDGIFLAKNYFMLRKIKNTVIPKRAKPDQLCRGPHSWLKVEEPTPKGVQTAQVCRICGLISGTNLVASQEAIDEIEEDNKHRDIEGKLYDEFLKREDDEIRHFFSKEIEGGVDFGKLAKVHAAGITFYDRFSLFKSIKNKEIQKELRKTDS